MADDDGNKQWSMLSRARSGFTRTLEKQMPLCPPFRWTRRPNTAGTASNDVIVGSPSLDSR